MATEYADLIDHYNTTLALKTMRSDTVHYVSISDIRIRPFTLIQNEYKYEQFRQCPMLDAEPMGICVSAAIQSVVAFFSLGNSDKYKAHFYSFLPNNVFGNAMGLGKEEKYVIFTFANVLKISLHGRQPVTRFSQRPGEFSCRSAFFTFYALLVRARANALKALLVCIAYIQGIKTR